MVSFVQVWCDFCDGKLYPFVNWEFVCCCLTKKITFANGYFFTSLALPFEIEKKSVQKLFTYIIMAKLEMTKNVYLRIWKFILCCHFKFCHNGRNHFKLKFGFIEDRKGHVLDICQFAWPSLYYNWVVVVQESTIKAGSGSRASRAYSRFLCQLCIYYVTFTKHMQISKTGNNVVRPHLEISCYQR